jgi:hypothetical protein
MRLLCFSCQTYPLPTTLTVTPESLALSSHQVSLVHPRRVIIPFDSIVYSRDTQIFLVTV